MNLQEYFATMKGTGFLATTSGEGKPDIAVYSRPFFLADGTLAFLMRDRLTHANLLENGHAAYAYHEHGAGYRGIRLFLKKTGEDTDAQLMAQMTRRSLSPEEDAAKGPKFIVYFQVEQVLTLVGANVLDCQDLSF